MKASAAGNERMDIDERVRELLHRVSERELIVRPQGGYARVEVNDLRDREIELIRETLEEGGLETYPVTKGGHTVTVYAGWGE